MSESKEIVEEKCPHCGYDKSSLEDWYAEDMPSGFSKDMYFELRCNKCKRKFTHVEKVCNG